MQGYFITGTDTDVGKTVAASWFMLQLDANYWKPVQSGMDGDIDKETVRSLTGYEDSRFLDSTYELSEPLSPHEAARRDGIRIDLKDFELPKSDRPLVVEGAGGLMVPLNEQDLVIDLIAQLGLPLVLVSRSQLGTINHTLLSLEAIQSRGLPLAGIIINGEITPHNREALLEFGQVPVIAEIDWQKPLNKNSLLTIQPEMDLKKIRDAA